MKQETANLWLVFLTIGSLLVAVVTLAILSWYAFQTWKMQKAVTKQSKELNRQIGLSVRPAFTSEFVKAPDTRLKLHNVGNGIAINIRFEPIKFPWSGNVEAIEPPRLAFESVPLLQPGETILVPHGTYAFGGERPQNFLRRLEEPEGKVYELKIRFRDIEGTESMQSIFFEKDGARPAAVKLAEPRLES